MLEALYDAVYAAPHDDEPRRVLADALLERGDPRGELIALQLARDGAHEARERELLAAHGDAWLGELAGVGDVVFERGFPSWLELRRARGEALPARIRIAPTLETLEIHAPSHAMPALDVPPNACLRDVRLDIASVERDDLAPLAAIESLTLRATSMLEEAALAKLADLRVLALAASQRIVDLRHLARLESFATTHGALPRLGGRIHALNIPNIRVGQLVDPMPLRTIRALAWHGDEPYISLFLARYPEVEEVELVPFGDMSDAIAGIAARYRESRVLDLRFGKFAALARAAPGDAWRVTPRDARAVDDRRMLAALEAAYG